MRLSRNITATEAAWKSGVNAYRDGLFLDACPHDEECCLGNAWIRGWIDARDADMDGTDKPCPIEDREFVELDAALAARVLRKKTWRCQWRGCRRRYAERFLGVICCGCCREEVRAAVAKRREGVGA